MKDFDTKNEAQAELEKHQNKSLGFCPIIIDECNIKCICFSNGEVYPIKEGYGDSAILKYRMQLPRCNHALISGEFITYEQNTNY